MNGASLPTANIASALANTSPIEIRTAAGQLEFRLQPSASGYTLNDKIGTKIGQVKIDGDEIKIKVAGGAWLAEAKRKDIGFKIYRADRSFMFKVKAKGGGRFKLKASEGTDLGVLEGTVLKVSGTTISATAGVEGVVVSQDGETVAIVNTVKAPAAAFLGMPELSIYERIVTMLAFDTWER